MEFKNSTSNLTILNNGIKGNPNKPEFDIKDEDCYQYNFKEIVEFKILKDFVSFIFMIIIGLLTVGYSLVSDKSFMIKVYGNFESREEYENFPTFDDKIPLKLLLGLVIIGYAVYKGLKTYKNINLNVNVLDKQNKKKLKKIYVSTSIDEINEIKNILEKTHLI